MLPCASARLQCREERYQRNASRPNTAAQWAQLEASKQCNAQAKVVMMMRARQKYPDLVSDYEEAPTLSPIHRMKPSKARSTQSCATQCSGSEEKFENSSEHTNVYTAAALCPGTQTVIQRRKQHRILLTRDFSSPHMQPSTQPVLLWGCETARLMLRNQPIIILHRMKEHASWSPAVATTNAIPVGPSSRQSMRGDVYNGCCPGFDKRT